MLKTYRELAMRVLSVLFVMITFVSCDDSTDALGVEMMPGADFVTRQYSTYDVQTLSYAVGDSVLARSSTSYLGRFTDPETGTVVQSDFLAQFHCTEEFSFPDSISNYTITSTELRLYVTDFVGDSLANFKLSVYPLNTVMDADADYYTNINPEDYYDTTAEPIATKWYSLADYTISDDERTATGYNRSIRITLPTEVGQAIYDAYRTQPELFTNTETLLNSGLPCTKGFYFKVEAGDGAIAYIDVAQFNFNYRYYDSEYEKDTLGVSLFASTEEVVQATRFDNEHLDQLMEDTLSTYLKCPAGIFTLVDLPIATIEDDQLINSAKLTFTRYNDRNSDQVASAFKLAIPRTLLLVRLDDYLNGYFEKYSLADSETSYLTTFSAASNTYVFNNISKLISTIKDEIRDGTATENAAKLLLIPVQATYDSSGNLVKLSHDFSMSSTRLVGGAKDRSLLEIIYSRYN
ncbi:MAG: DUF4270 domain-containing protein [Prevotellaceae bacterium]|nr:DUF4270 domain-containing protein [Prevotellaceae bacterium]